MIDCRRISCWSAAHPTRTYRWRTKTWIKTIAEYRKKNKKEIRGHKRNDGFHLRQKMESKFKRYKSRATGSKYEWKGSLLNMQFTTNMGGFYWQQDSDHYGYFTAYPNTIKGY